MAKFEVAYRIGDSEDIQQAVLTFWDDYHTVDDIPFIIAEHAGTTDVVNVVAILRVPEIGDVCEYSYAHTVKKVPAETSRPMPTAKMHGWCLMCEPCGQFYDRMKGNSMGITDD